MQTRVCENLFCEKTRVLFFSIYLCLCSTLQIYYLSAFMHAYLKGSYTFANIHIHTCRCNFRSVSRKFDH